MVVHICGTSINLNGRVIQRCCVCGLKLLDTNVQKGYLVESGHYYDVRPWLPGIYLIEDGAGKFSVAEKQPEESDLCLELVEC
jgi:hypothetical protein